MNSIFIKKVVVLHFIIMCIFREVRDRKLKIICSSFNAQCLHKLYINNHILAWQNITYIHCDLFLFLFFLHDYSSFATCNSIFILFFCLLLIHDLCFYSFVTNCYNHLRDNYIFVNWKTKSSFKRILRFILVSLSYFHICKRIINQCFDIVMFQWNCSIVVGLRYN